MSEIRPDAKQMRESLLSFVRRRFSNIVDIGLSSEDIVDEAFAAVFSRPDGLSLSVNFAYLSTVCVHVACRVYRKLKSDSFEPAELDCLEDVRDFDDPSLPILREEAIKAIADSLCALRDVERAIVARRYFGDCSFAEISRDMGINLNTVLSHHRRALEKLRPRLASYFEEKEPSFSRDAASREPFTKYF